MRQIRVELEQVEGTSKANRGTELLDPGSRLKSLNPPASVNPHFAAGGEQRATHAARPQVPPPQYYGTFLKQ